MCESQQHYEAITRQKNESCNLIQISQNIPQSVITHYYQMLQQETKQNKISGEKTNLLEKALSVQRPMFRNKVMLEVNKLIEAEKALYETVHRVIE